MADIETDRIKVVIDGDDKKFRKTFDDAMATLDKFEKKATGTGEASRESFDKITDAAEKSGTKGKKAVETLAATLERTHPIADKLADSASRAGKALEGKLANGAKAAGKALLKLSVWPLVGPLKAVTGAFAKFGSAVSKLFSKIKSVIMYRAIRSAIRMVTDGFKEGTANAYQWSKAMGGQFAASMDMLATSSLYLKNSLGALVTPLINAVAPAIDYVVDKFIDLLNIANQVIALLTGASSWTKAVKYPKEYAAAANDATGSAGKLAKAMTTILAIDELNPLNADKGSGGGGGGGTGSALDYSSMFEEQSLKVSSTLANMFEPFKKAWNNKGAKVVKSMKNALNGIKSIAGAVKDSFWQVWTNGTGQKTIEHILDIFANINDIVGNIGSQLAKGWRTDNLGTQIIQNLWNTLNSILGLWNKITESTANWAKNLNFEPIIRAFEKVTGAIQPLVDTITNGLAWAWENILLPFGKWSIEEAIPGVLDLIAAALEGINKVAVVVGPVLKDIWDEFLSPLADLAGTAITEVLEGMAWLVEKIFDLVSKAIPYVHAFAKAIGHLINGDLDGAINELKSLTNTKVKQSAGAAGSAVAAAGSVYTVDVKGNLVGLISSSLTAEQKKVPTTANINKKTYATDSIKTAMTQTNMAAIINKKQYVSDKVKESMTTASMVAQIAKKTYKTDAVKNSLTNQEAIMNIAGRKWGSANVQKAVQQPEAAINVVSVKGMPSTLNSTINATDVTYNGSHTLNAVMNIRSLKYNGNNISLSDRAKGGAFYGGKWHNIAQYATGGLPDHGTLFAAGEAGAEVVGHIGGRTEVLNQSQLASTMAAATQMGMASQNNLLQQLVSGVNQLVQGQGDVRAYIPAGEVVTGLQRNNRRDGRALVPMGV